MNIIEIVYNWPAEVFIQRHVEALNCAGIVPVIVARHSNPALEKSASIQQSAKNALIMPNFDHMSLWQKATSLRNLANFQKHRIYKVKANTDKLRDKVLISFFKSLKPDLIHFHFAGLAVNMGWIPQTLGIPYTLSLRGSDVQVNPLMINEYQDQLRETITQSFGVHSVCDCLWNLAEIKLHLKTNKINHKTIYTTVPFPINDRSPKKMNEYEPIRFITTGRIHWSKAYVNLLIALRNFIDNGGNATLTIIGDGNGKEELIYWLHELKLDESVNLIGKMAYDEFSPLMMNSDAYIQSSIAEGFSNSTAEAMAMGLPVFATNVGGTSEIIQDGINGFLLDPHNPQDWWKKLIMMKNNSLVKNISKNSFVTAENTFVDKKHALEFKEFYETVINAR